MRGKLVISSSGSSSSQSIRLLHCMSISCWLTIFVLSKFILLSSLHHDIVVLVRLQISFKVIFHWVCQDIYPIGLYLVGQSWVRISLYACSFHPSIPYFESIVPHSTHVLSNNFKCLLRVVLVKLSVGLWMSVVLLLVQVQFSRVGPYISFGEYYTCFNFVVDIIVIIIVYFIINNNYFKR